MDLVDYDYYVTTFGGNLVPAERFSYYSRQAVSYVMAATFQRAAASGLSEVRDCICELSELYFADDTNDRVASESVGALMVSYREDMRPLEQKLSEVCRRYLMHTGLLYRGVVRSCR